MISKQNLWFLTLFSLILVLSVYYVTMPNDLLKDVESDVNKEVIVDKVTEVSSLVAMRVSLEEERQSVVHVDKIWKKNKDIFENFYKDNCEIYQEVSARLNNIKNLSLKLKQK